MKGEGSQYPSLFVLSCYSITMPGASCGSARNSLLFGSLLPNSLCIVLLFRLKYKGGLVENFFLVIARLSLLAKACCIYLVL